MRRVLIAGHSGIVIFNISVLMMLLSKCYFHILMQRV